MYANMIVKQGGEEFVAWAVVVNGHDVLVRLDDPEDEGSTAVPVGEITLDARAAPVSVAASF